MSEGRKVLLVGSVGLPDPKTVFRTLSTTIGDLVHMTDGVAGARLRLAQATKYVTDFGIATECGFGRQPPETIRPLLDLHREIAWL